MSAKASDPVLDPGRELNPSVRERCPRITVCDGHMVVLGSVAEGRLVESQCAICGQRLYSPVPGAYDHPVAPESLMVLRDGSSYEDASPGEHDYRL